MDITYNYNDYRISVWICNDGKIKRKNREKQLYLDVDNNWMININHIVVIAVESIVWIIIIKIEKKSGGWGNHIVMIIAEIIMGKMAMIKVWIIIYAM